MREIVLGDTATSRPCRYSVLACSTTCADHNSTVPGSRNSLVKAEGVHVSSDSVSTMCRPPMQPSSDQAKPAATMNTCGAMMVGSNQSKDACNDGIQS